MVRMRRLRQNAAIRSMVAETTLRKENLIYPLFVVEGEGIKNPIPSMKDCYHFSPDMLADEIKELRSLGIGAVILFGLPGEKDCVGTGAWVDDGVVQQAIRAIKKADPDMLVVTDVCMCEYTDHGHCGILDEKGYVKNDETLHFLAKISVSHAKAGADIIAPSDMMDFRVAAIREALDNEGFENVPILSYSAKYASAYYGPFRDAAGSAPQFGDRKAYQMDIANSDEALREVELDIEEGADMIMVKPALSFLDIIRRVKDTYNMPLCAYNVSGEYAMLWAAIDAGLLDEKVIYETVLSIKRAGADMIITYFAKYLAERL